MIADQAIEPILDSVGDIARRDVLDICCGTGNLARAVATRSGRVTGIDFAPTMIEIARSKVAGVNFQVGDAEALQFPNQSFDVALCSFGLWHMSEPDMALAEAARVLKTDRVYGYTTWVPPQQGWDMFDLLMKAVHAHGTVAVEGQMRARGCSGRLALPHKGHTTMCDSTSPLGLMQLLKIFRNSNEVGMRQSVSLRSVG